MSCFPRPALAAMRPLALTALVVSCAPAQSQSRAEPQSLAEAGRQIAEEHCSRCHVIDPDEPFAGIGSTPSFQLLVTAFPDWRERFETFYGRRPHPAVVRFEGVAPLTADPPANQTVDLKLDDIDAIVAFALSLHNAAEAGD